MPAIAKRDELETSLRGIALRLMARQLARAGFNGLAGAGAGLGLGVLFLGVLPRVLFEFTLGAESFMLCALAGFAIGVAYQFRRFTPPSMQDAALSLEARLERDTGALATVLRVEEDSAFYHPLLARAGEDLELARRSPAPVLIPTARLVVVPLTLLASIVALVWVLSGGVPPDRMVGSAPEPTALWTSVDIGGGRSAEDDLAYRKALGLRETATTLKQSAATLRDGNAAYEEKREAFKAAKAELVNSDAKLTGLEPTSLPDELPDGVSEQSALADRISAAAARVKGAAARVEEGAPAVEDTGGDGDFGQTGVPGELAPVPPAPAVEPRPREAIAMQTPARRRMAKRAIEALERIRNE